MKSLAARLSFICAGFLVIAFAPGCRGSSTPPTELSLALAPYQDLAMIVNAEPLGLTVKYGTKLKLVTMAWEDILPTVASAGQTVDVGFGSLIEFLTKEQKLNAGTADPLVFVQPLYVYKGGGFIAFDSKIQPLDAESLKNQAAVAAFLRHRIGAQKQSVYEMMIFTLARQANVPTSDLHIFDTPLNDGLLATQQGSLDVSSAGLTQLTEARKRGGRMVLAMEDAGFADVTGFIARRSILESKRAQIEALVRMWFDSVNYVTSDLRTNSKNSLDYLQKNAATQYTFEEYSTALSQEFLPHSLEEANRELYSKTGKFSFERIADDVSNYLIETKTVQARPGVTAPLVTR